MAEFVITTIIDEKVPAPAPEQESHLREWSQRAFEQEMIRLLTSEPEPRTPGPGPVCICSRFSVLHRPNCPFAILVT